MNRHELQKAVRENAVRRTPAAMSPDGGSVTVPSWCFQGLNAGWWRYYAGRTDLPGESQCSVIADVLEAMNAEAEESRTLPSESTSQARGVDSGLGRHKVRYTKEGGSHEGADG